MLRPIPFAVLVTRLVRELEALADHTGSSVYELPAKRIWRGAPSGVDLSIRHHGRRAASPFGPAAGPHTQLAQNVVAAWLAGARVIELKTVQVRDDLSIPRPCIDMATVGYNIEWSQELTLAESAREYVKAAMLVTILARGLPHLFPLEARAAETVFDLSVGYDLAGIRSPNVVAFLDAMRNPSRLVVDLLSELPPRLSRLSRLPYPESVAHTVTLSTFHGCPPDDIEAIVHWLMEERGLDVTVKLNPTLLGRADLLALLHDHLDFRDIEVPASAFEHDPTWEQVAAMVARLRARAADLGRSFGVKLTNTLIVNNRNTSLPTSEPVAYLSGPPLHVLALELARRFRATFGDELPISFSAGVDRHNAADTVACGFTPVTACSDLLQTGGYARLDTYLIALEGRMAALGVHDIASFIDRWHLAEPGAPLAPGTPSHNVAALAAAAVRDPRYWRSHMRPPKKVERTLGRFDCLNCEKCLPVCPNLAIMNVTVELDGEVRPQIAILADACNDCGNCATFCPEHGAPNLEKPRLHLSADTFVAEAPRDGLLIESPAVVVGRVGSEERRVSLSERPADPAEAELFAVASAALHSAPWIVASHPRGEP